MFEWLKSLNKSHAWKTRHSNRLRNSKNERNLTNGIQSAASAPIKRKCDWDKFFELANLSLVLRWMDSYYRLNFQPAVGGQG